MNLTVVAHTNAKKNLVKKNSDEIYHVYVSERPIDGAANKAIINSLAAFMGIKRHAISLIRGEKSKLKVFKIVDSHIQ